MAEEPPRILSISYDPALLTSRNDLLRQAGYAVTGASNLNDALYAVESEEFDLVIVGHSLPEHERRLLVRLVRQKVTIPLLVLSDDSSATPFTYAEVVASVHASTDVFLHIVASILKRQTRK